jgi:hypothetical protein
MFPDDGCAAVVEVARGVIGVGGQDIQAGVYRDLEDDSQELLGLTGTRSKSPQLLPCLQIVS